MITFLTLIQTASILGVSVAETQRLVRRRQLAVHHMTDRIKYFDVTAILSYVKSVTL
jgi:hypothetical protein